MSRAIHIHVHSNRRRPVRDRRVRDSGWRVTIEGKSEEYPSYEDAYEVYAAARRIGKVASIVRDRSRYRPPYSDRKSRDAGTTYVLKQSGRVIKRGVSAAEAAKMLELSPDIFESSIIRKGKAWNGNLVATEEFQGDRAIRDCFKSAGARDASVPIYFNKELVGTVSSGMTAPAIKAKIVNNTSISAREIKGIERKGEAWYVETMTPSEAFF